jgi:hypothetical protein
MGHATFGVCLTAQESARATPISLPSSSWTSPRSRLRTANRRRSKRGRIPLRWPSVGLAASKGGASGPRTLVQPSAKRSPVKPPLLDGGRKRNQNRWLVTVIFDRFAQDLGEIAHYPVRNVEPAFGEFAFFMGLCRHRALLHVQAFCPTAATYRLENGWLWNGDFNACAGIEQIDGVDCVAINVGIAHLLCNLFRAMLSHPGILANVGDSKREAVRPYYNPEALSVDLGSFQPLQRPNDPWRARYAYQLSYCAFHFIFLHEFGHLFHGHVDWLFQNLNFRRLGEIGASSIPGLKPLDLQTIEMDADSFGIGDLLTAALGVTYDPANRSKPPFIPERNTFGTREVAIYTVMLAVYCVFRLFGNENLADDASVFNGDHPPAYYRHRFVAGSILEHVQSLNIISMPDFGKLVTSTMVQAEEAFALLSGKSVFTAPAMTEGFERSHKLLNILLQNWKKLRPELELLKRGGELHE